MSLRGIGNTGEIEEEEEHHHADFHYEAIPTSPQFEIVEHQVGELPKEGKAEPEAAENERIMGRNESVGSDLDEKSSVTSSASHSDRNERYIFCHLQIFSSIFYEDMEFRTKILDLRKLIFANSEQSHSEENTENSNLSNEDKDHPAELSHKPLPQPTRPSNENVQSPSGNNGTMRGMESNGTLRTSQEANGATNGQVNLELDYNSAYNRSAYNVWMGGSVE